MFGGNNHSNLDSNSFVKISGTIRNNSIKHLPDVNNVRLKYPINLDHISERDYHSGYDIGHIPTYIPDYKHRIKYYSRGEEAFGKCLSEHSCNDGDLINCCDYNCNNLECYNKCKDIVNVFCKNKSEKEEKKEKEEKEQVIILTKPNNKSDNKLNNLHIKYVITLLLIFVIILLIINLIKMK